MKKVNKHPIVNGCTYVCRKVSAKTKLLVNCVLWKCCWLGKASQSCGLSSKGQSLSSFMVIRSWYLQRKG